MINTIKVNGKYILCFSYDDCLSYDIYGNNENWLGRIPMNEVMDNCIDEETEEFDEDGLEILIDDLVED